MFTVLTTWQRGRELVTARREREEGPLRAFVDELHERRPPVLRVPGTAVFLNRGKTTTPLAMRANVEHNHVLHEHVVILSIETLPVPHVPRRRPARDRRPRPHRRRHHPRRPPASATWTSPTSPLCCASSTQAGLECPLDVDDASYFLSTIDLHLGDAPGMSRWRKRLFLATSHITADAADYFGLPRERTVIMGARIDL